MKKQFEIFNFIYKNKILNLSGPKLAFYEPGEKIIDHNFIVPNMATFVRDVTELGNLGALKKRLLTLNALQILRLIYWNITSIPKIVKKEFAYGVLLLIQIELLSVERYKPSLIVLSDQIIDLSLALKNEIILIKAVDCIRMKLPNVKVAIMTNNLLVALERLSEWKATPDLIFTPINYKGYEMNPSQIVIEGLVKYNRPEIFVAMADSLDYKQKQYLLELNISKILLGWF